MLASDQVIDASKREAAPGGRKALPKAEDYKRRLKELQDEARDWVPLWTEVQRYCMPWRGRFLLSDRDLVQARLQKDIYNNTVQECITTAASGVQGVLCNDGSRWFGVGHSSYDVMNDSDTRYWLDDVENDLYWAIGQSKFYDQANDVFAEVFAFGHGTMLVEHSLSSRRPFRTLTLTAGAHWLANDADGDADTVYRRYQMTAGQMREYFGKDAPFPDKVREAIDEKRLDRKFYLIQAIQPWGHFSGKKHAHFKYESVHFVEGCRDDDRVLKFSGYRTRPFVAVRWGTVGDGVYAYSPAMMTMADIHSLYGVSRDIFNASNKRLNPPLAGSEDLTQDEAQRIIRPGSYTVASGNQNTPSIWPIMRVDYDLAAGMTVEEKIEGRIRRMFFNHLFFTTLLNNKKMTAAEVEARAKEQLFILGPVVFRLRSEYLSFFLDRIYEIRQSMVGAGGYHFPVAPESLEGKPFEFTFTSDMSKAQELLQYAGLDAFMNTFGAVAGIDNAARDKIDTDEMLDVARKRDGLPSRIIRDDKQVENIRQARAAAEAKMQQQQQIAGAADVANKLGNTPLEEGNVLSAMVNPDEGGGL